jgi:hypothetical protein
MKTLIYLPQAIGTHRHHPIRNSCASSCHHLQSASHLPSASATTSIGHRHRSITIPRLGHILLVSSSASIPIGNSFDNQSPLFRLPIYISLALRYVSKDTCPKIVSTVPNQPAPNLCTHSEKLEGLSDIFKGMETSNNLRDKLIGGMDNQLGISLKLIRSLKRDKDKLEAEVATLQEEIQGLNNKGQR